MINPLTSLILILTIGLSSCNRSKLENLQYLDQDNPELIPKIFAKGFISTEEGSEYGSVFNEDWDEFYFGVDLEGRAEIRYTELIDNEWTIPQTIITNEKYSYNDPYLSPDEKRLYYISDMPRNETDTIADYDIWYSTRLENGWSSPINAGNKINTDRNEFYISFADNGTMYFASHRDKEIDRTHDLDIYCSKNVAGDFQNPEKLSDAINSRAYEADVFIAPDESYIIFCSARRSGLGRGDLYVSFKDKDNKWTDAVIMGDPISTPDHELCPFVSKDGKYFFYTSKQDIYWVSSEIIETYNPNKK